MSARLLTCIIPVKISEFDTKNTRESFHVAENIFFSGREYNTLRQQPR